MTDQPYSQNTAYALLLSGLAAFLVALGSELLKAHTWAELTTPSAIGTLIIQLGGVGVAVFGALKRQP